VFWYETYLAHTITRNSGNNQTFTESESYVTTDGQPATDRIEKTASNSFSIALYAFVIAGKVFTELLPNNGHLFWLHYSRLLGGQTQTTG
jgi:hypothetical protein